MATKTKRRPAIKPKPSEIPVLLRHIQLTTAVGEHCRHLKVALAALGQTARATAKGDAKATMRALAGVVDGLDKGTIVLHDVLARHAASMGMKPRPRRKGR
jgi:hypothetical protein